MRFLAAPWIGLLAGNVWLQNAERGNSAARKLAKRLEAEADLRPVFPVEANAVFIRLSEPLAASIQARGWHFYKYVEPDVYRLMCSWAVTEQAIEELVSDVRDCGRS